MTLSLATVALWGYLGWLRRLFGHDSWSPRDFWPPDFDAYVLGLTVQEWLVPLGLLVLLTLWPPFRRTVLGEANRRERAIAALALLLVQAVFFAYLWAMERHSMDHFSLGELVVVFGGIVLGPGWGLVLGVFTGLAASALNLMAARDPRFGRRSALVRALHQPVRHPDLAGA